MVSTGSNSALQRKMEANREGASGVGKSAAGALRLSIARAAADLFDLAVSVIGILHARPDQKEIAERLSEEKLLILLDGPSGEIGAMAVDRALMVALIQQQTMGRLTAGAVDDRPFTATDAALVEPLIDATLIRAAELAEIPADVQCLSGFRFGARVEDRRTALLALDADRFRVFDLTLELDGGPQQGGLCLILPEPESPPETQSADAAGRPSANLGHAIGSARADLNAVLSKVKVPLAELSAMQPGELLPLVQERLDRIELVTITGEKVAVGRLGQAGGLRALRMNESRSPMPGGPGGFAEGVNAKSADLEDPMIVEGHLVDPEPANTDTAFAGADLGAELEEDFSAMSPEEAVVEISALAGLDPEEANAVTDGAE